MPIRTHAQKAGQAGQLLGRYLFGMALSALAALVVSGCAVPLPAPFSRSAVVPLNGAALTPPRTVPDLTLQRADGRPFSTAELHGRLSLVFFGYTFCPDVCPLTLSEVAQVRKLLGSDGDQLDVYFVTVDPARDSPARLRTYVRGFDQSFEGLTGETAELEQMRAAFGAVAQRREALDGGPSYFMDHTAALFLVSADGTISLVYSYGTPPDQIADDVHQLVRR